MRTWLGNAPVAAQAASVRMLFSLPAAARRALAGPPVRIGDQQLDLDMQLFIKLQSLTGRGLVHTTPEAARREVEEGTPIVRGPLVRGVATRTVSLPDGLAGRLYTPGERAPGNGLLVFYHGGGWVVGSLDSHDHVCRYLARHAGVKVLSVAYRLAPEHPFPAPAHDAYAGFRYAVAHADELGVDPDAIAVGGDSAGGNLAIVTALQAVADGGARPAYQLLFYPGTDHTTRRPSRDAYGEGFFLTDEDMNWFGDHYVAPEEKANPLASPLLAPDLSELPPAYLAVAGFDPLCDEGEAFAHRLTEAGVPVTLRRFDDLIHGYANFFGFSRRAREAMADAALALHRAIGVRAVDRRPG
ncbi:MAG: alpha/beta hydrolase [Micromonosporaceae bacterium]